MGAERRMDRLAMDTVQPGAGTSQRRVDWAAKEAAAAARAADNLTVDRSSPIQPDSSIDAEREQAAILWHGRPARAGASRCAALRAWPRWPCHSMPPRSAIAAAKFALYNPAR